MNTRSMVFAMSYTLAALFCGCYGWEYPRLSEIRNVESTAPSATVSLKELSDSGEQYLRRVVEVHGIVRHVVSKGGQPAVALADDKNDLGLLLTFGPDEKKVVGELVVGTEAFFKGLLIKIPSYGDAGEIRPAIVEQSKSRT